MAAAATCLPVIRRPRGDHKLLRRALAVWSACRYFFASAARERRRLDCPVGTRWPDFVHAAYRLRSRNGKVLSSTFVFAHPAGRRGRSRTRSAAVPAVIGKGPNRVPGHRQRISPREVFDRVV